MPTRAELKRRIDEAFDLAEKDAIRGKYTPQRTKACRENMAEEIDHAIQRVMADNFGKKEISFCPGHFTK